MTSKPRYTERPIVATNEQAGSLKLLVSELIKKEPDHKRIKELAQKTGVDYLEDPIEMMSLVLHSMDQIPKQMKRKAHETSL